ncbi:MAG: HAD family phosphatase [Clostridia bacterium]|nr:HAD family phosphatase [Clostridia bacterium]
MQGIYVFDLDGTLVDSMPYFTRGLLGILDEEGVSYGEEMASIITPLGYTKSAIYFREHFGLTDSTEALVKRMQDRLVGDYANNISLKPGVYDYLRRLHEGGARLFVLTASPHCATDACLSHNGVFEWFETVWSVEDFSLDKTDTRLFFEVARRIGCAPAEVHYFDDNLTALQNAHAAGYHTYGVYDGQSDELLAAMKPYSDETVMTFLNI